MTSWLNQVDKTFLHLINGFIRVKERVEGGGGGGVVLFGWRLHRGDYGQASLIRHFRIQFGRIEIYWNLLTLNGLGSNSTMVG